MRFWDSSAIVPLVVEQPASSEADRWLDEDPIITLWTLTSIEVVSALRRLVRDGLVTERQADEAERRAEELVRASHVVVHVEDVKRRAARLLRLHALRAADAVQLGAALEWASGNPTDRVLHTFDRRLGVAARREGFVVVPDPA